MNVILKNTGEQISVTQTGHGSYRDNDTGVVTVGVPLLSIEEIII